MRSSLKNSAFFRTVLFLLYQQKQNMRSDSHEGRSVFVKK
ncbi:hypothetical protein D932_00942 [Enterococcus casseliflavus 14-MB-W-14]|nr:hypothetical protein D932_00942 [Enterococcus casseliflavus 14-MB-W-14]